LQLETAVAEPIVARAVVTLFDVDSPSRAGLPALDPAGNEVTPIVGQIKIVPQTWPEYTPQHPATINFNHALQLTGYDLTQPSNHPTTEPPNHLTLYWRSLAPVNEDYVIFIHLLDASGNVIAQADAPPTQNAYPTSWWAPGEQIADVHTLPTAPGVTSIRLGLYDLTTGQRLSIVESSLPGRDDSMEIALPK
jgi:hypothetical protein